MIRLQDIQTALMNVVGWQQDFNPEHKIDKALCQSESGLTFQGAHPLVTLANIRAIMPDDYLFQYPEWNEIRHYKVGMKVRHDNILWIANHDNVGQEPKKSDFNQDFNNDFGGESPWVVYNMVSDFVRQLTINGINTTVQNFLQDKELQQETRNLLERRTFFDGAARLQATIDPTGKIVGFEIVPVRSMGVTTKIERIGLQMVGGTGKVKLYLFHSSQVAPMRVIELNFTNTNGGFQWFTPEEPIYLPYIPGTDGDGNDAGGAWFLCYNQNELPAGMQALNVSKDWSVEPCQTCLGGSIESWRQMTKYLQVSPFGIKAPADFADYPEMFDIGQIGYTNTMNYGMNVEISVGCDLTDFIISQRAIFATVIQRQVAANVLRTIAMNPDVRVNRNQVNVTRDELLYELDGAPQGRAAGLGYELKQAYRALSLDTRGLDRICLQCNNHGVKYRTV
jgi:hypothetical protein